MSPARYSAWFHLWSGGKFAFAYSARALDGDE